MSLSSITKTPTPMELLQELNLHVNEINGKVSSTQLATVAISGSYNDLVDKPTVTKGIAFCLIKPAASEASARFVVEKACSMTQVRVVASAAPSASTAITVYKNGVSVTTQNFTLASTTFTVSASFAVGDVLHVAIGSAVNGVVNLTVQLTVVE